MPQKMSQQTKNELLGKLRSRYARAGKKHKSKILDQVQDLVGLHRKSAIRALTRQPQLAISVPTMIGRPLTYDPEELVPVLRPIWLAAQQPCGRRLVAMLPDWIPAYEEDHKRLGSDVRQALLKASAATLDRLLQPLRVQFGRGPGGTKPGSLLRQEIPIRGGLWEEDKPGWLEVDTVALCGGRLDDQHSWMLDCVDICTHWVEMRGLENRSQERTLAQLQDIERQLPFAWLGMDSDNGGEFLNWHVVHWCAQRARPVRMTRARPYHKNDNAHVEQRNYTHVREWFGYERYENPAVVPLINQLCTGALGQLLNYFMATMKLLRKEQVGSRIKRIYGKAQTPYARLIASDAVTTAKKAELERQRQKLNPLSLAREVQKQLKHIDQCRRA